MANLLGLVVSAISIFTVCRTVASEQAPLVPHASNDTTISVGLFAELEELARIVDISYCVGTAGLGITKPFECASRCSEFENFELVTVCCRMRFPLHTHH
jgi:hypothetical protein